MNHKISLEEWQHNLEIQKKIILVTLVKIVKNAVGYLKWKLMDKGDINNFLLRIVLMCINGSALKKIWLYLDIKVILFNLILIDFGPSFGVIYYFFFF